ncbi:MAG: alpha/beta fold hydrolase [Actinomycetota bacterium]|jgi:pimeloyl-ACP methyl ester carboxylesterase|nr:alpha/beta fold hydrolase [Actinomycetota bacterium]
MPTLDVGDCAIAFDQRGAGAPVLLIHGASGDAASYWSSLRVSLATDWRVVTYDQRGFGRSHSKVERIDVAQLAGDAAALLDHLDAAPAAVVGLSLGGMVAQQLAATRPDLVRCLVLAGTGPKVGPRLSLLGSVLGRIAAAGDADLLFDANLLLTHGEAFIERHADQLSVLRQRFATSAATAMRNGLQTAVVWPGVDPGAIRCPTLVVHGEEDAEMPVRYGRELAEMIVGAHLEVLPDAGHKCSDDQPDRFADLVRGFLLRQTP